MDFCKVAIWDGENAVSSSANMDPTADWLLALAVLYQYGYRQYVGGRSRCNFYRQFTSAIKVSSYCCLDKSGKESKMLNDTLFEEECSQYA